MLKKAKHLGKYKIFLMTVYMIFKEGKRFRCAPSFNKYVMVTLKKSSQIKVSSPKFCAVSNIAFNTNRLFSIGLTDYFFIQTKV